MTVTYSRYKIITDSLPKRPRGGRFTSETAVRRFQKRMFVYLPYLVDAPLQRSARRGVPLPAARRGLLSAGVPAVIAMHIAVVNARGRPL